jgi:Leucine-rich repeat (LRR) protein
VEHSFSGTAADKSSVTIVVFYKPSQIEFLPNQILTDFPRLNGIRIWYCKTFTTIRDSFFGQDFNVIQYLSFYRNKIATIEANAFQHLTNLKWIDLGGNQLSSLPHQIFRNNPELFAIWLPGNKINSITPDFFKNLNKLQCVYFGNYDQCTKKIFDCHTGSGSCSISQPELDSGLSSCYNNCLGDVECASKSGKLDNLSSGQIEVNIDLIVSSGHTEKLIEKGYSNLVIKKESKDLLIETDQKFENVQKEIGNFKNESLQSDTNLSQAISKNSGEIKKL